MHMLIQVETGLRLLHENGQVVTELIALCTNANGGGGEEIPCTTPSSSKAANGRPQAELEMSPLLVARIPVEQLLLKWINAEVMERCGLKSVKDLDRSWRDGVLRSWLDL